MDSHEDKYHEAVDEAQEKAKQDLRALLVKRIKRLDQYGLEGEFIVKTDVISTLTRLFEEK
jgi:hypothetical protein